MMKSLKAFALALVFAVAGCASTGTGAPSPEAQIATGANAVTATAGVATVLLRNEQITLEQAKGFRAMLGAASTALDSANATLVQCRKETGVFTMTADPCRPRVADLIALALDSAANVKRALDARGKVPPVKTLGASGAASSSTK